MNCIDCKIRLKMCCLSASFCRHVDDCCWLLGCYWQRHWHPAGSQVLCQRSEKGMVQPLHQVGSHNYLPAHGECVDLRLFSSLSLFGAFHIVVWVLQNWGSARERPGHHAVLSRRAWKRRMVQHSQKKFRRKTPELRKDDAERGFPVFVGNFEARSCSPKAAFVSATVPNLR